MPKNEKRQVASDPKKTTVIQTTVQAIRSHAMLAANPTKRKIVGMEPTLPTIRDPSVTTNKNGKRTGFRQLNLLTNQKTNYAAPALRGNRREGEFNRGSPTKHKIDTTTECNGTPTEDWLRRQAIATIKRHNAKKDQQKEYPEWIEKLGDGS